MTVFNFAHPPILSALLLKLSASTFLAPHYPLLVPMCFLFSVCVCVCVCMHVSVCMRVCVNVFIYLLANTKSALGEKCFQIWYQNQFDLFQGKSPE